MAKLTNKQMMFCKEYLIDLNATQAAIRAGYSEKTANRIGHENLTKLDIQEYINELMQERSQKAEITAETVLNNIVDIIDRCMQKTPVMEKIDGEWVETGEWKFDANNALKGNELLGKHLKLFTDKVEHSGEIKLPEIIIKKKE